MMPRARSHVIIVTAGAVTRKQCEAACNGISRQQNFHKL